MTELIRHVRFLYVIKRKTPCIISIENLDDKLNQHIHKLLDKIKKEFPFLLYYKISIAEYKRYHLNLSIYGPNNVISFQLGKITNVVDGTNYDDLYKLFWKVYFDSCTDNLDGFLKVLVAENVIPHYPSPHCVKKEELDVLIKHEDGILSKLANLPNKNYPEPKFILHAKSVKPKRILDAKKCISPKSPYTPKNSSRASKKQTYGNNIYSPLGTKFFQEQKGFKIKTKA